MKKEKDKGPEIKRDSNGQVDREDADKVVKELTTKLITESRDFQREITFKHSMNNRRDIIVKTVIYTRNTVNGMIVKEDSTDPLFERLGSEMLDPYRYKYFDHIDGEIFVREMPMSANNVGRWSMGMFKALVNYLARMNVMNRV
jgi:hypothetical protein